ncbi:hypothetical protein L1049_028119 [Liquidambar formosana]|uniref:NAC domain-containing protein n=1 Tax=Liquidambar formosana TaxID=63359 RepID=A0AAP0RIE6_LIQFO
MADKQYGHMITKFPVGYRFVPTEEELVTHYLMNKVSYKPLPPCVIEDIDATKLYSKPPPKCLETTSCEEREWFFFIHQDENFEKPIRMVGNGIGFWKSSGEENLIYNLDGNVFASKTYYSYFRGTLPKAKKTHWKMEEYRIHVECNTKQDSKKKGHLIKHAIIKYSKRANHVYIFVRHKFPV